MTQIIYPHPIKPGDIIGVTAPSTGLAPDLEARLQFCIEHVKSSGFNVKLGKCLRSSNIVSASALERANEFIAMLQDKTIAAINPPWGGELLINMLPYLDFEKLKDLTPKWIVGFSDLSTLLMPFTMLTGIATLHGSNFMETPYSCPDGHMHWLNGVQLKGGDSFVQKGTEKFQAKFTRYQEVPNVTQWNYADSTKWKVLGQEKNNTNISFSGRLIGGCLDVISMLPGTKYGNIEHFAKTYANDHGLIIYLELCEEKATTACRMFHHLKLAGWFNHAHGILIGRTNAANFYNLTQYEALQDVFSDINVPVIYDMDIGHVPPQMLLVNGALATVKFNENENSIEQRLI